MIEIIASAIAWAWVGYSVGYIRAQKRYIPEINEAREDLARVRMLAKLHVCPRCEGERATYNFFLEEYVGCKLCGGTGEVRNG